MSALLHLDRRLFLQACLGLAAGSVTAQAGPAEPGFKMQVAGRDWVATRSAAFKTTIAGALALNINGFLDGPKISRVSFLVYPPAEGDFAHAFDLEKATAADISGKAHTNTGGFDVDMLGGNPLDDNFRFTNGKVTITAYDAATKTLSGTFAGQLRNNSGATTIEIVNGQFAGVDLTP